MASNRKTHVRASFYRWLDRVSTFGFRVVKIIQSLHESFLFLPFEGQIQRQSIVFRKYTLRGKLHSKAANYFFSWVKKFLHKSKIILLKVVPNSNRILDLEKWCQLDKCRWIARTVAVMKIRTYIISFEISFSMSYCFQAFVCLIDSSVEKTYGLKTFETAEELILTEMLVRLCYDK